MKNLCEISNNKDIITKEYSDASTWGGIQDYFTNDGWHVRKWPNGYLELAHYEVVGPFNADDWSTLNGVVLIDGVTKIHTLPVTLVKRYSFTYSASVEDSLYGNGCWISSASNYNNKTQIPMFAIWRATKPPAGRNLLYSISVFITGTWK